MIELFIGNWSLVVGSGQLAIGRTEVSVYNLDCVYSVLKSCSDGGSQKFSCSLTKSARQTEGNVLIIFERFSVVKAILQSQMSVHLFVRLSVIHQNPQTA